MKPINYCFTTLQATTHLFLIFGPLSVVYTVHKTSFLTVFTVSTDVGVSRNVWV